MRFFLSAGTTGTGNMGRFTSLSIVSVSYQQAEYGDLYAPFEVMLHLGIEDGVRLIMLALVIWAQA